MKKTLTNKDILELLKIREQTESKAKIFSKADRILKKYFKELSDGVYTYGEFEIEITTQDREKHIVPAKEKEKYKEIVPVVKSRIMKK